MNSRITMLATALMVVALLSFKGFAQDPAGTASDPGLAAKAGHTLNELGRGIKTEVKQVGQRINDVGQGIKYEATQVSVAVTRKFDAVKLDVQRMPIHHRVYSRIHWDKELMDAKIEVHMLREGVVLLRGSVPTEAARSHAVALATGTPEVTEVIDELKVPAKATQAPSPAVSKPAPGHQGATNP